MSGTTETPAVSFPYHFRDAVALLHTVGYRYPEVVAQDQPRAVSHLTEALVTGPDSERSVWQADHLALLLARLLRAGDFIDATVTEAVAIMIERDAIHATEIAAIADWYHRLGQPMLATALLAALADDDEGGAR